MIKTRKNKVLVIIYNKMNCFSQTNLFQKMTRKRIAKVGASISIPSSRKSKKNRSVKN